MNKIFIYSFVVFSLIILFSILLLSLLNGGVKKDYLNLTASTDLGSEKLFLVRDNKTLTASVRGEIETLAMVYLTEESLVEASQLVCTLILNEYYFGEKPPEGFASEKEIENSLRAEEFLEGYKTSSVNISVFYKDINSGFDCFIFGPEDPRNNFVYSYFNSNVGRGVFVTNRVYLKND